jgi:hypothetical protein
MQAAAGRVNPPLHTTTRPARSGQSSNTTEQGQVTGNLLSREVPVPGDPA